MWNVTEYRLCRLVYIGMKINNHHEHTIVLGDISNGTWDDEYEKICSIDAAISLNGHHPNWYHLCIACKFGNRDSKHMIGGD